MGTCKFNAGGNPAMDWHPIQGGVEIFLVASCHGNRDELRPDGPLGSYADFTLALSLLHNKLWNVMDGPLFFRGRRRGGGAVFGEIKFFPRP